MADSALGKDTPGSPITEDSVFPERALAWELNYRGELGFLQQARSQASRRGLVVEDGWRYFIHGWTTVIEEVFDVRIEGALLDELSDLALSVREGREGGIGR